jgi:hypothetical protein
MAIIDEDIVVKFGADGKLTFKHPEADILVFLEGLNKDEDGKDLPSDKQAAKLWDRYLIGVEGLSKKDGTPVTVESLKAGDHSPLFFRRVLNAWVEACRNVLENNGADAKNG